MLIAATDGNNDAARPDGLIGSGVSAVLNSRAASAADTVGFDPAAAGSAAAAANACWVASAACWRPAMRIAAMLDTAWAKLRARSGSVASSRSTAPEMPAGPCTGSTDKVRLPNGRISSRCSSAVRASPAAFTPSIASPWSSDWKNRGSSERDSSSPSIWPLSGSNWSSQRRIRPSPAKRQILARRAALSSASPSVRPGAGCTGSNRPGCAARADSARVSRAAASRCCANCRAIRSARRFCRTSSRPSRPARPMVISDSRKFLRLLSSAKPVKSFCGAVISSTQSWPAAGSRDANAT